MVDPSAPIIPGTMRVAQTTEGRLLATCKGTRRLVRAILRALVHTLSPLENQRFLHSVTIVRAMSDNCQVLRNGCPALSRPVNAYPGVVRPSELPFLLRTSVRQHEWH